MVMLNLSPPSMLATILRTPCLDLRHVRKELSSSDSSSAKRTSVGAKLGIYTGGQLTFWYCGTFIRWVDLVGVRLPAGEHEANDGEKVVVSEMEFSLQ